MHTVLFAVHVQNAYCSRFHCNKNLPCVFSSFRTGAGLKLKKCGAGAGWDGLRGGLEVCVTRASKISQTHAGAGRV